MPPRHPLDSPGVFLAVLSLVVVALLAWLMLRDPGPCHDSEALITTTVVGNVGVSSLYCPHPEQDRSGLVCTCRRKP